MVNGDDDDDDDNDNDDDEEDYEDDDEEEKDFSFEIMCLFVSCISTCHLMNSDHFETDISLY